MRVGILGAGQLALMLAEAGRPLGMSFAYLCPDPDSCAAPLGTLFCAGYEDAEGLAQLADSSNVVTYEFENVPAAAVTALVGRVPVHPRAEALHVAQDRLREKRAFTELGIGTPAFRAVDDLDGLRAAVDAVGLPAVLKTRTEGYDGKGQAVLRAPGDVDGAWAAIGRKPAILEAFVPFEREVSIIATRATDGQVACYPLSENHHRDGILRLSVSRTGEPLQAAAEAVIGRLLDHLGYVGTLALELFVVDGGLMANEMAPRVHNSGHWTIEGATTSQFENHLRAVTGMPLGPTDVARTAAMVNLIGEVPNPARIAAVPGAVLHDYGKAPRAGRKVGHVTLLDDGPDFASRLVRLLELAGETELAAQVADGRIATA